ncbi:integrase_H2C2 domain-containing protein [Trichonephila clavipes]|nr:integrase_H2C2 domain-containing protein [Trichonephila clavipes]
MDIYFVGIKYSRESIGQLVIPKCRRTEVLKLAHTSVFSSHMGPKKTLERIKYSFFWEGLGPDVKKFCESCKHVSSLDRLGIKTDHPVHLWQGLNCHLRAVGSLVVRASDSRPEGLGSMPDATKHPPSTHGFTCRNCGGGDRGRVALYRPFGEFRRAKIALSPVWCSRPTTGVPLAHATMIFVGFDLTTSDRLHQTTTTKNFSLISESVERYY